MRLLFYSRYEENSCGLYTRTIPQAHAFWEHMYDGLDSKQHWTETAEAGEGGGPDLAFVAVIPWGATVPWSSIICLTHAELNVLLERLALGVV